VSPTLGQIAVLTVALGSLCALGGVLKRLGGLGVVLRDQLGWMIDQGGRLNRNFKPPPPITGAVLALETGDVMLLATGHVRPPPIRADAWSEDRVGWLELELESALSRLDAVRLSQESLSKRLSELLSNSEEMLAAFQEQVMDFREGLGNVSRPRFWESIGAVIIALGAVLAAIDILA
jgi:hypothetical protein